MDNWCVVLDAIVGVAARRLAGFYWHEPCQKVGPMVTVGLVPARVFINWGSRCKDGEPSAALVDSSGVVLVDIALCHVGHRDAGVVFGSRLAL